MPKTDFSLIQFDAERHSYTLAGQELTGVTRYLKQFQEPFDRLAVAERVANKFGHSVQDVLAEWERRRELGIKVHEYIESSLAGSLVMRAKDDPFLALNGADKLPECRQFDLVWGSLAEQKIDVTQVEWVIGDADWGLGGMTDCLLYSHETGQHHLWDWKTGRFDTRNRFQNLLGPFAYLDASKLNIYSLQLSLYRLIIERNTELELGPSYIVHLQPDGYDIHKALDLREPLQVHLTGGS